MSSNYKIKKDVDIAHAMAQGLASYVRGDELYGNTGTGGFFSAMPSLTVGALILRLRRVDVLREHEQRKDRHRKKLDQAVDLYTMTRKEWTHHYTEKMRQEAHSRLDAMAAFFRECADSELSCLNNYRPELLRRTIVQEIMREMTAMNVSDDDLTEKLNATDSKFRTYMRPDEFQWSDVLAPIYPQDEFWWLYQKPPQPET